MKKLLLTALLLAVILPTTMAQFTKIGASLGYDYRYVFRNEIDAVSSHKLKNPVLSFTGIYEVNLPFHLVPRVSFYFPNVDKFEDPTYSSKTTISGWSLDIDGHYVFNSLDQYEIYGIAGLNMLFAKNKWKYELSGMDPETEITRENALGLNLGAGGYWKVKDGFDLFFEAKAVIYNHPEASIKVRGIATAGILLNMEYLWSKEKDSGY